MWETWFKIHFSKTGSFQLLKILDIYRGWRIQQMHQFLYHRKSLEKLQRMDFCFSLQLWKGLGEDTVYYDVNKSIYTLKIIWNLILALLTM